MAEDIKQLIEKIQQEGVDVAQKKAQAIEQEAQGRGEEIIKRAQKKAKALLDDAREEIARLEKSSQASLAQAARDTMIQLRQEIEAMLEKLTTKSVQDVLSTEELKKIISALIKESSKKDSSIVISLSKEDAQRLEKGFLRKLCEETKKEVALKTSAEITAGFIISYDAGKSHFDFSDKALAGFISNKLKSSLTQLLDKQV